MKRKILISGASRGIGKAIAIKALEDGHQISLGLRKLSSIKNTILDPNISNPDKISISNYDSLNKDSAKKWVQESIEKFKGIDTVIHSAGIFNKTGLLFEDNEITELDKLWKINFLGPWILTKECWNQLIKSKRGRVIILVSMSGKRSKGNLAGYSATKFALMSLSQTIRNEGWEKGIRVTALCPGWVNTDMAKNVTAIDHLEMTQPEDIALICSNLLQLPNSSIPFEINLNCILEK